MIYYSLGEACREASRRESITDREHQITRSIYLGWPVYEVSPIIAVSTLTDPYILEQAYEQDEENLVEDDCPDCGHTPCLCDTEPEDASMVTGYDNGPTYW